MAEKTRLSLDEIQTLSGPLWTPEFSARIENYIADKNYTDKTLTLREYAKLRDCPRHEDPKTLREHGIIIPKLCSDVDQNFLQVLLTYRQIFPADLSITSCEREDVGPTAGYFSAIMRLSVTYSDEKRATQLLLPKGFIVKCFPELKLIDDQRLAHLFVADLKAYYSFPIQDYYPRPRAYLTAFDEEEERYCIIMEDLRYVGKYLQEDVGMDLQTLCDIIPDMARVAANFENCHLESHPFYEATKFCPIACDPERISAFKEDMLKTDPAIPSKFFEKFVGYPDERLRDFTRLFQDKILNYFTQIHPSNGGSITISHGDFRGDNLYSNPGDSPPYTTYDFQLITRGSIASDISYLITTSLSHDLIQKNFRVVLRKFYDEFQKYTKEYKSENGYTYEIFENEFRIMFTMNLVYFTAWATPFFLLAPCNGINPQTGQPDPMFPITMCPELGTLQVAELSDIDRRRRGCWARWLNNAFFLAKELGVMDVLEKLPSDSAS